ncbi:MAG TPA: chitobiase/beta-hexosaminidase C-terminal domain-containing protein [Candidatus Methylomirabilis sp.]|nr:chitobiase/beta-hexosaminidase C-terminal domain-containing protein [Candidatus Methylomirabilis sp.]
MTYYNFFIMICILVFAVIDISSAAPELPFKRVISVNEWGMQFSTKASIDRVIDDVSYMNGDAIVMYVGSEYFEAVRDPARADWDKRASWDMLEYAIKKAHERNIQLHVALSINIMTPVRAESRLFGSRYNVVYRDGSVDPVRIDHAFAYIQDYEAGLIGFIANHYPSLDGIHIEEPFYTKQSYSTAMRDRVKAKYGYDPLTRPAYQMVPIINGMARDVFIESFTKIRASFNANRSNPNMLLSANAADCYRPVHGFDPGYMSDNNLLDWYAAQINTVSLSAFKSSIKKLNQEVNDIPVVPISYITYSYIFPNINPSILDQVEKTCEYGGYAEWIFAYYWRNKIIDEKTVYKGLHNLPVSSLCSQPPIVLAPTLSLPSGIYQGAQNISISASTPDATIRYTIDGTIPVPSTYRQFMIQLLVIFPREYVIFIKLYNTFN